MKLWQQIQLALDKRAAQLLAQVRAGNRAERTLQLIYSFTPSAKQPTSPRICRMCSNPIKGWSANRLCISCANKLSGRQRTISPHTP